jgi:adenylate kinase
VVILLGAPGAGKGTQAKRLSSDCSLPHVSTGDLFRENLREDTELGRKAKGYMESGKLVPDALVLDMLFDRVARPDCDEGYVLDGFPRTLPQAEAYEDRLDLDTELVVADLEVPDDVIVERAAGRLLCKQCGNIQHKTHNPPRVAGTCDVCGGELYQRKDDAPDVVRERLAVYHRETAPLVEFYGERDMLTRIDGRRSPEAVYADLLRLMPGALRERGAKR